jgi:hypothetical protein
VNPEGGTLVSWLDMSCDEASPGLCFVGQQAAGMFFGFFFGTVTFGVNGGVWWSGVPGVVVGSTMGILAAKNPDGIPELTTFLLVFIPVFVVAL